MPRYRVIVQASSRSWSGGNDLCMNKVNGHPIVYWTIKKIFDNIQTVEVSVIAPEFDRGGNLDFLLKKFSTEKLYVYYGHDDSPLDRILDVCHDLEDSEYIIRVDGLHMFFDVHASINMVSQSSVNNLDCCKFPDDFPVQFTSDVYRVGGLRRLAKLICTSTEREYKVHPKFYMFYKGDIFHCAFLEKLPIYSDYYLLQCRNIAQSIYQSPRQEINKNRMTVGDQLGFHYELALKFLDRKMKVLDIASGSGYGTVLLAKHIDCVYGADIDSDIIEVSRKQSPHDLNIHYSVENVTDMTFASNEFDAIASMETIEHVDYLSYLREVSRVLKPNGILILSTPQNCIGHIPINATHVREYSLDELINLCKECFIIDSAIGIKAGRIVIPDNPTGTNTVLVCRKAS